MFVEIKTDDVPGNMVQRSQIDDTLDDDEPPPPIPPKRFEGDPEESQYDDVIK